MNGVTTHSRIAVISGIPGAGKTTLARLLADRHERGVHLESDRFLYFLAHPVNPFSLESRDQAAALARAVASSALSMAQDGYQVFVDGVVGPWHFEIYESLFGPFDYAVLELDVGAAIERKLLRGDPEPEREGVTLLWQFFQRHPDVLARHGMSASQEHGPLIREFERRRAAGELLRLS